MNDPTYKDSIIFTSHMSQEERDIQHEKVDQLAKIVNRLDVIIILGSFYAGIIIVLLSYLGKEIK